MRGVRTESKGADGKGEERQGQGGDNEEEKKRGHKKKGVQQRRKSERLALKACYGISVDGGTLLPQMGTRDFFPLLRKCPLTEAKAAFSEDSYGERNWKLWRRNILHRRDRLGLLRVL